MIVLSLLFLLIFEPIISSARPQGSNYCIPCPVLDPCSYCPYPSCQPAPQQANVCYPSCRPAAQQTNGNYASCPPANQQGNICYPSCVPASQPGNLCYPSCQQPLNLCVVCPECPKPEPPKPDPPKPDPPKPDPPQPDPPKPEPLKPIPPKPIPGRRTGSDLFGSMLSMPAVFADAMMNVK